MHSTFSQSSLGAANASNSTIRNEYATAAHITKTCSNKLPYSSLQHCNFSAAASLRQVAARASTADKRKNPELYKALEHEGSSSTAPSSSSSSSAPPPALHRLAKPEILAPAGGWPQLKAAVEAGANAVYFGVSDFNARARANNFEPEELPAVMDFLHQRGLKGYVTLNVLIFQEELERLEARVRQIAEAGVDAVIVQDIGAVELIRRAAPGLPIHGSTQMSITSPDGSAFAASRGVERIVVGRELSVPEIAAVSSQGNAEVEAFVHGALCVSYSGQCFSSEAWGGRSANRGQCAQACRKPYGLLVDGSLTYLGDVQYLLSPQDLAAIDLVPDLIQAGVVSFKIEGRLKGPEYVAVTTSLYRKAVDVAWEKIQQELDDSKHLEKTTNVQGGGGAFNTVEKGSLERSGSSVLTEEERRDLAQVFSRGQDAEYNGLTPGFLLGPQHQMLVRGRAPRHRGLYLGTVLSVTQRGLITQLATPLKLGDGLVVDAGNPQEQEEGGAVYEIHAVGGRGKPLPRGGTKPKTASKGASPSSQSSQTLAYEEGTTVEIIFGRGQVNLGAIQRGDLLWKTRDSAAESRARSLYEGLSAAQRRRLKVTATLSSDGIGHPLLVTLTDSSGLVGRGSTDAVLQAAEKRALSEADVVKALGQHLGDEGSFVLEGVTCDERLFNQPLFIPGGEVKLARRRAVAALLEAQGAARVKEVSREQHTLENMMQEIRVKGQDTDQPASGATRQQGMRAGGASPTLRVLCRNKEQVEAAAAVPWLGEIILDFLEVKGLREACATVRGAGKRVVVATPRVLKPDERRLWLFYLKLGADALLIRSAGLLHLFNELGGTGATVPDCDHAIPVLEGDFSLNAANALGVDLLLESGLQKLTLTHDLNAVQLMDLANTLGSRAAQLECVLHQHLPIFHTEHCVFCRFVSTGNSYIDCGKPCEKHVVHLRDEAGLDCLVLADQGCRNTVFDAAAQSALPFLHPLVESGYGTFRIELVDEPAVYVKPLLERYQAALLSAVTVGSGEGGMKDKGGMAKMRKQQQELWEWLDTLPDANGRRHGVGLGSLEPKAERAVSSMKPTAASLRS